MWKKLGSPIAGGRGNAPLDRDALVRLELDGVAAAADDGSGSAPRVDRDIFGIALSGGGIRSATFNLGLLQGLAKTGLLRHVDYLATVSGGGYIGGFWTAWRHNRRRGGEFPDGAPAAPQAAQSNAGMMTAHATRAGAMNAPHEPGPGAAAAGGAARAIEDPAIRHLRRFSNFLSPRLGLLSYDTGRLVVAGLTSAIPTVLATLALLLLAVLAWALLAEELFTGSGAWLVILPSLSAAVLIGFEAVWRRREQDTVDVWYYAYATLATALAGVAMALLLSGTPVLAYVGLPTTPGTQGAGGFTYFAPAAAWGAAFGVLALLRAAASRYTRSYARVHNRGNLDRVLSRLVLLVAVWSASAGLWLVADWLLEYVRRTGPTFYSAATALLTSLFVWTRGLGADEPSKPFGSALAARLRPRVPQLLAYLVVIATVLGVMMVLMALEPLAAPLAAAAVAITLAMLVFFHPNRVGLHSFYRGRLARAYLGASNESHGRRRPFTDEVEGDDMMLDELRDEARRPLHLVCCAVNDLTPTDPLSNMQRGAASAVLSPIGIGVDDTDGATDRPRAIYHAPWSTDGRAAGPTLAGAITASGAAFNSMMGTFSKRLGPAATFVLAMLNLRLGLWLRHPRYMTAAPPPRRGLRGRLAALRERLAPKRAKEWWLPGVRFYQELFGMSSAQGRDIHLSDGGHFENTAVYELIRRECRYIIASDCGADPDRAFDDVANLIRRVRQDFGAEIRIDLSPLRLDDEQCARQPMVAGDIHYASGDVGVLLLFKPTLVGSEPPDILQYRTRNRVFPNESTGDQFYDEAQWESYRRLGEHAAESAFAFMDRSRLRGTDDDLVRRVFAHARFEWLPKPPGFPDRLARFAERAAELDIDLAGGRTPAQRGHAPGAGAAAAAPTSGEVPELDVLSAVTRTPRPEYGDRLLAVRRALLLLEETYYAWDLEETHGRPVNLGIMNTFGRWAQAPLLRSAWPVLKALCSPAFSRFMENTFGLAGGTESASVAPLSAGDTGYAAACWEAARRQPRAAVAPDHLPVRIGYTMRIALPGGVTDTLLAALVHGYDDGEGIYWNAADFYVPPGLWGIGIGEDFLRRLRPLDGSGHRTRVRIDRAPAGDPDAARQAADRRRMYAAAGFATTTESDDATGEWLTRLAPPLRHA